MADMINFHLPSLPGGDSGNAEALKQIKSYLFQLTEQMRYYLNNIDTDNFTEEYNRRLSTMVKNDTQNSIKASVSEQKLKRMQSRLETEMASSINRITGASGGFFKVIKSKYVDGQWTETEDADGIPSGWCIMNTPGKDDATKVWRFTAGGLMYNSGPGAYNFPTSGNTSIAIDMDGHINASMITTGTLNAVDIEGVNINGCTLSGNTGVIGGFTINDTQLESSKTIGGTTYTAFMRKISDTTADYAAFAIKVDNGSSVSWPFYIRYNGRMHAENADISGNITATSGKIGGWNISTGGSKGFYADYIGSVHAFRVYMQPAYYQSAAQPANDTWVFSTQHADVTNGNVGGYSGTFIVYADGRVDFKNTATFNSSSVFNKSAKFNDAVTFDSTVTFNDTTTFDGIVKIPGYKAPSASGKYVLCVDTAGVVYLAGPF